MPALRSTTRIFATRERSRVQSMQTPEPPLPPREDYSCHIKGMYRLLDLITELGSSGLGDRLFLRLSGFTRSYN